MTQEWKQAMRVVWTVITIVCGAIGISMCFTYDADAEFVWVIGPSLMACAVAAASFAIE